MPAFCAQGCGQRVSNSGDECGPSRRRAGTLTARIKHLPISLRWPAGRRGGRFPTWPGARTTPSTRSSTARPGPRTTPRRRRRQTRRQTSTGTRSGDRSTGPCSPRSARPRPMRSSVRRPGRGFSRGLKIHREKKTNQPTAPCRAPLLLPLLLSHNLPLPRVPLVCDGQTSPHRPRLVVSRSTCPPLLFFCFCKNK